MITFEQIEKAIKPNFVFEGLPASHRLETSWKIEGSRSAALIVFVGIAHFNGFKKADTIHYLEIKKSHFDNFLARFTQAYNEYSFAQLNELYCDPTANKKIIAKFNLVTNALKLIEPNYMFISMADLNH